MHSPHRSAPARGVPWMAWLLLALGVAAFVVAWVALGFSSGRQNSWMAVLAALDVALMLRLGGWRPGPGRVLAAMGGTVAVIAMANWGQIAAQLGRMLGYPPWESAVRLGPHHAWTLAQLANGPWDLLWWAVALVVAALVAR
jgi:hypothetical protein